MTPEAFDDLLAGRWSCRAFKPSPVDKSVIEAMLATAQRTASWNNVQPWEVVVVSGAETQRLREKLLGLAEAGAEQAPHVPFPERYEGVYRDRRRACGFQLYNAVGVERGDKAAYARQSLKNFGFFGAPHVAIITCEKSLGAYGLLDCGGYLSNLMSAASSQGIATIAQAALALHSETIHEHIALDASRIVVCGMSFGYADMTHPVNNYRVPRADIQDVVTWVGDPAG